MEGCQGPGGTLPLLQAGDEVSCLGRMGCPGCLLHVMAVVAASLTCLWAGQDSHAAECSSGLVPAPPA